MYARTGLLSSYTLAYGCALFVLAATAGGSAQAPAATEAAAHVQVPALRTHGLSPLVEIGWYDGCVGGLQVDTGAIALRATGGYFPILLLVTERDRPGDFLDVELLHSAQGNADVIWFFHAPSPRSRIGLSLGYHYNSILQHGVGLAFQGEAALADELIIEY